MGTAMNLSTVLTKYNKQAANIQKSKDKLEDKSVDIAGVEVLRLAEKYSLRFHTPLFELIDHEIGIRDITAKRSQRVKSKWSGRFLRCVLQRLICKVQAGRLKVFAV